MKVYVIHGSPLSGKSTFVNKHKGPNDLMYDFDVIMSAISGLEVHERNDNLIEYVKDIRDLIITKLKSEKNIDNAWIITTRVSKELEQSLVGLNPIYKQMKIDIYTAKKRLKEDPGNRNINHWDKVIEQYFTSTKDYSGIYNTPEWKSKRIVILKRDGYKCRECKRFGKVIEADTVHHILPVEERPDLRLTNSNLLSLCEEHHEKMHNKYNNTLSKLGEDWKSRTVRKCPELLSPPTLDL